MALYGVVAGMARRAAINAIKKKLLAKGATSAETAVATEEAGITSKRELDWVKYLARQGVIGRTDDGKIWWITRTQKGK